MVEKISKEDLEYFLNRAKGKNALDRVQTDFETDFKDTGYQILGGRPYKTEGGANPVCFAVNTSLRPDEHGMYEVVAIRRSQLHDTQRDTKNIDRIYKDAAGNVHQHPNIVRYIGEKTIESRNRFYFISERLGYTFEEIIKNQSAENKLDAIIQICEGLNYLHHQKNLVHRDIKPDNIGCDYVDEKTGKLSVKLIDFGSACAADDDPKTGAIITTLNISGSVQYSGPDTTRKKGDVTCDIIPVGWLLWEVFTPEHCTVWQKIEEFYSNDVKLQDKIKEIADRKNVSEVEAKELKGEAQKLRLIDFLEKTPIVGNKYITAIIKKAMQPDSTNRYQSASEMKVDLQVAKRSNELEGVLNLYRAFNDAEKEKIAKGEVFDLSKLQNACSEKKKLYDKLAEQERKSYLWNTFEQMIFDDALAGVWDGVRKYAHDLGFEKPKGVAADILQHYKELKAKLFSALDSNKQTKIHTFAGKVLQLCDACGDSPNY